MSKQKMAGPLGWSLVLSIVVILLLNYFNDATFRRIVDSEISLAQRTSSSTVEMLDDIDEIYLSSLYSKGERHGHNELLLALKQQVAGQLSELDASIAILERAEEYPHLLHLFKQLRLSCSELLDSVDHYLHEFPILGPMACISEGN